ncbi:hypothetical protein ILUMI_15430, partial [Ignelater luminosus]
VSTVADPEFINNNIPIFIQSTYDKIHNKVCDGWEETTMKELFRAAEEEKLLTIAAGGAFED